jgi:hypothetical protein
MVPVVTHVSGDVDEARAFLGRYFYSGFIDVLSWKRPWQTRFDVTQSDTVALGDLQFGTDVKVRFGELGAYHVDLPMTGSLTWRQGRSPPSQATTRTAAVFQPVGDTSLEKWDGDCRLLAVKIDRAALEIELLRDRVLAAPRTSAYPVVLPRRGGLRRAGHRVPGSRLGGDRGGPAAAASSHTGSTADRPTAAATDTPAPTPPAIALDGSTGRNTGS